MKGISICCFLFAMLYLVAGQPTPALDFTCLTFENFQPGTQLLVGSPRLDAPSGVTIVPLSGFSATIEPPIATFGNGNYLFKEDAACRFIFPQDETIFHIRFLIRGRGGAADSLSINQVEVFVGSLVNDDIETDLPEALQNAGYVAMVTLLQTGSQQPVRVIEIWSDTEIESIDLGGQELDIDDICWGVAIPTTSPPTTRPPTTTPPVTTPPTTTPPTTSPPTTTPPVTTPPTTTPPVTTPPTTTPPTTSPPTTSAPTTTPPVTTPPTTTPPVTTPPTTRPPTTTSPTTTPPTTTSPTTSPPTTTPPVTTPPTTSPPTTSPPTTTPPTTSSPTTSPPTTTPPVTTPPTTSPPTTSPPTTTPPTTSPPTTSPPTTTPPTTTPPTTTPPTTSPPTTLPPMIEIPDLACGEGRGCNCVRERAREHAILEAVMECSDSCRWYSYNACAPEDLELAHVEMSDCEVSTTRSCTNLCPDGYSYEVEVFCQCQCDFFGCTPTDGFTVMV